MSQHRKPAFAISKKILKKIVSHLYPLMTRKKNRRNIYFMLHGTFKSLIEDQTSR